MENQKVKIIDEQVTGNLESIVKKLPNYSLPQSVTASIKALNKAINYTGLQTAAQAAARIRATLPNMSVLSSVIVKNNTAYSAIKNIKSVYSTTLTEHMRPMRMLADVKHAS